MLEDRVAVGVEGDGYAEMLHQTLDQKEVVATVFLLAEEGVNHRTGGIIHRDQQRERRRLVPQPGVMTAVHLDQHALPGHALAAYTVLGRTPSPWTGKSGVQQDAPQGDPAVPCQPYLPIPVASFRNVTETLAPGLHPSQR